MFLARFRTIVIAFYLQFFVLLGYNLVARGVFHFERPGFFVVWVLVTALVAEYGFNYFFKKTKRLFPLSALITGFSCALLIDAPTLPPYLLAITLALFSKYAFVVDEKRHYFNPANFGVVLALLFYPGDFNLAQNIFASSIPAALSFFCFGVLIAALAGKIMVALFWLINFSLFAILRSQFDLDIYLSQILILFSSSMILFSFNMITDPKTSPASLKGQYYFTFIIAALDTVARFFFIPYSNFFALFVTSALMPIIKKGK